MKQINGHDFYGWIIGKKEKTLLDLEKRIREGKINSYLIRDITSDLMNEAKTLGINNINEKYTGAIYILKNDNRHL